MNLNPLRFWRRRRYERELRELYSAELYSFEPRPDVTAYELALLFKVMLPKFRGPLVSTTKLNFLQWLQVRRPFAVVDSAAAGREESAALK